MADYGKTVTCPKCGSIVYIGPNMQVGCCPKCGNTVTSSQDVANLIVSGVKLLADIFGKKW